MDKNIYVDKDFLSEELKKKADSSHGTHLALGTTSTTAYYGDKGKTAYDHSQAAHAPSNAQKNSDITKAEIEAKLTGNITSHTHNYAGSSSAGGAANSVKSNMIVKLNSGSTEGTDMFTFNGSAAKTVNVTPSTIGAAASSHIHSATDISSGTLAADRLPTSGVTTGNYGPSADSNPGHNGTFSVPYITVDAKGRVTSASTKTITLPSDNNTDTKVTNTLNTTTKFYMTGTTATATTTGTQYFDTGIYTTTNAGQLQVTGGLITGSNIVSDAAITDSLGTSTVPWSNTYAKTYNLRANATGTTYGLLSAITIGTTSTTGEARLTLGNNIATGTADNSYGRIILYGTSTGYTALAQNNNTTSNITVTLPSAAGTLALTSHTHNYAGSSSAGGAATSANKVNSNLVVKLNSGSTEGTNLFTFNGSTAKTIDITPASIGAAASSHGTHVSYGGNGSATTVSRSDHTHNYAGSSSAGGAATSANKVNTNLTIKLNSGSTEGTNLFTFNGSAAKSINITPSAIGAAASSHGTHVEWSTTSPKVAGTAAVGSETKCARGDHVHAAQTSVSGNAGSATKLANSRNFKIGATTKSFNGTEDVSWSLGDIMKSQGLSASTACGTLYFNNGGTSHVGRLSMYNNADGDYVQLACYNVSDSGIKNYITIYPNHISLGSYVIARGYIKPYNNGSIDLGASEFRWRTVYSANGVSTTSDRTLKENIKYVRTGDTEINYDDMYNFVKNDLELATYNYTNSGEKHINFIAQDLLANEDGTDNKVGQFIINPVPVPPKEDIESGKPYPLLSYNTNIYTSVLAGALKQAIQEVEDLKEENKELKETLHSLVSRIEALENR